MKMRILNLWVALVVSVVILAPASVADEIPGNNIPMIEYHSDTGLVLLDPDGLALSVALLDFSDGLTNTFFDNSPDNPLFAEYGGLIPNWYSGDVGEMIGGESTVAEGYSGSMRCWAQISSGLASEDFLGVRYLAVAAADLAQTNVTVVPEPATIVTFDDITTDPVTMLPIPDNYEGLNWNHIYVMDAINYSTPSGYRNAPVSGSYVAWSWGQAGDEHDPESIASVITVTNPDTFDFIGVYLTAAWRDDLNITVEGSRDDELLYSQTVVVNPFGPTWFDFDFVNIDHLRFITSGGTPSYDGGHHFVLDNFTFVPHVPQPATTYYVDALNGDNGNDGLSPETAFATIQKGIDSANDGDTVIVAPGTYTGDGNRDIDFLGKAITVRSIDPNNPNTVAATIIDCNGTWEDEHRGFYFHNDEDASSVVAGLTITNGSDGHTGYYGQGSGILCEQSSPTITDCIISDNVINSWGRGGGGGGAISIFQSICLINNCTISGNSGGGMTNSDSHPTLSNCTFSGNSGGGMYNVDSNPTLTNCTFSGNRSSVGGGMGNLYSSPTLTNCTFIGNSADNGGGMHNLGSNLTLTNCTFAGNSASNGNALACDSWWHKYPSNVQMTNCILWDGGNEIWNNDRSTITITYSDVQDGWPGEGDWLVVGGWDGEGNIDADPCFVGPGYWADVNDPNIPVEPNDPNAIWIDGDYHLLRTSPCIDAATDANVYTDIEGNIRPFDFPGVDNNGELPEFDMGAYEATAEEAELMILPGVINRRSRQRRILAWVRLPEGITRDQIDSDEPLLLYPDVPEANGIEAIRQYVFQNRRRRSQRTSILAFFDKAELMDAVGDNNNGSVELQVVGNLRTGQYFYGTDTVWITDWRRLRSLRHW